MIHCLNTAGRVANALLEATASCSSANRQPKHPSKSEPSFSFSANKFIELASSSSSTS